MLRIDNVTVGPDFPIKPGDTLLITDSRGERTQVLVKDVYQTRDGGPKRCSVRSQRMFKPRKLTKWAPQPPRV